MNTELKDYIRTVTSSRGKIALEGVPVPSGALYFDSRSRKLYTTGTSAVIPFGGIWLPNSDDLMRLIERFTQQKWPQNLARFGSWINFKSGNAPSVLAGGIQEALLKFYIDLVSGKTIEHLEVKNETGIS